MSDTISDFRGNYRFLSNFYPSEMTYGGCVYRSVEHAYQAAKTLDPIERDIILCADTPGLAKKVGRKLVLRPGWESMKLSVMTLLVRQKFSRNPLHNMLLDTAPRHLVEGNTWGDTFWGVCRGTGENHLGKILMKVRDEL